MRRSLIGGLGSLLVLCIGSPLLPGATGCHEPAPTSYGNPSGLDRKNLPGEDADGGAVELTCPRGSSSDDAGCPSFATDIFPNLTASGKWRCSDSACHGGANAPPIDGKDPTTCLSTLKSITVAGKPYLSEGSSDPNASAIMCTLQGSCGSRMPKPPGADVTTEDLCLLEAWLRCGAPP